MIRTLFLCVLSSFLWFACENDDFPFEKSTLLVETFPATDIDSTGFTLHGKISGQVNLTDKGFIFYSTFDEFNPGTPHERISLGPSADGNFSYRVTSNAIDQFLYTYRTFAIDDGLTAYGNEMAFTSVSSAKPIVDGLDKTLVQDGQPVIISGSNLKSDIRPAKVLVGSYEAEILGNSDTEIQFEVPSTPLTGNTPVSVQLGPNVVSAGALFIEGISIDRVSKQSLFLGDTITLTGRNFNYNGQFISIESDPVNIDLVSVANEQLVFVVTNIPVSTDDIQVTLTIRAAQKKLIFEGVLVAPRIWREIDSGPNVARNVMRPFGTYLYGLTGENSVVRLDVSRFSWDLLNFSPCGPNCFDPLIFTTDRQVFFIGGRIIDAGGKVTPGNTIWNCTSGCTVFQQIPDLKGIITGGFQFSNFIYLQSRDALGAAVTHRMDTRSGVIVKVEIAIGSVDYFFTKNQQHFLISQGRLYEFNTQSNTLTFKTVVGDDQVEGYFYARGQLVGLGPTAIFTIDLNTGQRRNIAMNFPFGCCQKKYAYTYGDLVLVGTKDRLFTFTF